MADASDKVLEQLKVLHQRYAAELPGKVAEIRSCISDLQRSFDSETLKTAHRLTHSLTGSGATFDYPAISDACRQLEAALKELLEQPTVAALPKDIEALVVAIEDVARNAVACISTPSVPTPHASGQTDSKRLIYIVDDDSDVARKQCMQYELHGYMVNEFHSFEGLEEKVRERMPLAILMDVMFPGGELSGIETIRRMRAILDELPPVIFVSQRSDLDARLGAVRAGAAAYFTKPVDVAAVVRTLDRLTSHGDDSACRVMVVDDDADLAANISLLLQQHGIETRVLTDPGAILESLATFQPELILMELYMSSCTGIELAAVIRQQEAYLDIPIVFISGETDIGKYLDGMRAGGDDFLIKPIEPIHLLATVQARVQRGRLITERMARDSLTGLLSRHSIEDHLARELKLQERHGGVLSYALFDLDHFKDVNEQYGHAAGDQVLCGFAGYLRQRFRKTDLIGRYGGEEFVVILLGTDADAAVGLVDAVRRSFARLTHRSAGHEFSVTFSAGIASSPPIMDQTTLLIQADEALHRAKNAGRNRIDSA